MNILVIFDGLDEYEDVQSEVDYIYNEHDEFGNMKFVMTTRMEAGLPAKLQINHYVRLLPFSEAQLEKFLRSYGLSFTYDILKLGLNKEEIKKLLVCWMFAMMES